MIYQSEDNLVFKCCMSLQYVYQVINYINVSQIIMTTQKEFKHSPHVRPLQIIVLCMKYLKNNIFRSKASDLKTPFERLDSDIKCCVSLHYVYQGSMFPEMIMISQKEFKHSPHIWPNSWLFFVWNISKYLFSRAKPVT